MGWLMDLYGWKKKAKKRGFLGKKKKKKTNLLRPIRGG